MGNFCVFIYEENNGSLIEKYEYMDLVLAFNKVIDNNILNEDNKWNIICDINFPPEKMTYDKIQKTFLTFGELDTKVKKQFVSIIKNVY